ncbi:hypothetical protein GCM10007207_18880 [Asaia siamensis]|uniref:Uncharacterized protein n=1 Tax=Asaia siamensis TaxID=110479 RepID=A0ABQ1M2D8_9PROT|nr:hypothetical protein AA0323_2826 [Asaia siamensis NRIC 0323]GGC33581.1 hypothetical protein GCM10007207_18880 [Asaia siamensis]
MKNAYRFKKRARGIEVDPITELHVPLGGTRYDSGKVENDIGPLGQQRFSSAWNGKVGSHAIDDTPETLRHRGRHKIGKNKL